MQECVWAVGHLRGGEKVLEGTWLSHLSCGKGVQPSGDKSPGTICTVHICPGIQCLLFRAFSSKKLVPRLTWKETPPCVQGSCEKKGFCSPGVDPLHQ